ncbi:MAG: aminoglycoside 3'-phosphotransferase [Actinobacteria bacterium]|nr:aminoglycoside 3'-phosphotransferase [Actinomycetota bacterium]
MSESPNLRFDGITVPAIVHELARGRAVEIVWRNEIGGVTYRLGDGDEYVKYGPPHWEFDADPEFERLRWVSAYVAAPRPIDHGVDDAGNRWLRTQGIPGTSAVVDGWNRRPELVVPELGRALRRFHDTVPVADCPWEYSIAGRLARKRAADEPDPATWPELDAVVCHGDACNPNFLLDSVGACVGYVDLGKLGVGDRWADLAPALLSLGWNFGDGWQDTLLAAYGIERDAAKLDFYTWLWNAT